MKNSITIKNLNFCFKKERNLISNFSYEFKKGNIYCLVGLNGSSKTTLSNLIANLYLPISGSINYFDLYEITNNKKDKKLFKYINKMVAILFQFSEKQLFCETILDDVMFGLINDGIQKDKAKIIASEYLKYFDISEDDYNKPYFSLSEGQRRKVALASIICLDREVYIFDEPTISLDYKTIVKLTTKINEYKKLNKIVIIVSHDFDWIYSFVDEILFLENGELKYSNKFNLFFKSEFINKKIGSIPFVESVINQISIDQRYNFLKNLKIRNVEELTNAIKNIDNNIK